MAYVHKTFQVDEPVKVNFYLAEKLNLPFSVVARLIDKGRVLMDGEMIIKKAVPIAGKLEVMYHEPTPSGLKPIFETKDFAVFNKPSGMLVHQNGFHVESSLVDDIKHLYGHLANLVHRIDRETSGLVIASKNKKAEKQLKNLFVEKDIEKNYLAFVEGNFERERLIDAPILIGMNNNRPPEDPTPRVLSEINKDGAKSRTFVTPVRYYEDLDITLVNAYPITGRTHQIRIHLAHVGHRILGDPFYGVDVQVANDYLDGKMRDSKTRVEATGAKRVMLHAWNLKFKHKAKFYIEDSGGFFDDEFLKKNLEKL
jgi:23S rRNA pseudouridine1911/1915/1917 synthase